MDRETVEEIKRHFGVIAEQLRGEIRVVAEGLGQVRNDVTTIGGELAAFRAEVAHDFDETRALIRLSYGELDRRVRTIEHEMAELRSRLERVEARVPE